MTGRTGRALIAIVLTVGVGWVAVDVANRAATLQVLSDSTANPGEKAEKTAERNFLYLFGMVVGTATGMATVIAAILWWRVLRPRK